MFRLISFLRHLKVLVKLYNIQNHLCCVQNTTVNVAIALLFTQLLLKFLLDQNRSSFAQKGKI